MMTDLPRAKSLPPEFHMSPVTTDDIGELVSCHQAAFNSLEERWWWAHNLAAMRTFYQNALERNLAKPEKRYYKITDNQSGEVAAWAGWSLPNGLKSLGGVSGTSVEDVAVTDDEQGGPNVEDEKNELSPEEIARKVVKQLNPPENSSEEALVEAITLDEKSNLEYNVKSMIVLGLLCTSPKFERRGLARALIEPMMDLSRVEDVPIWVAASPKGLGLYQKLGFKAVDVLQHDLAKGNKGLTGMLTVTLMKWVP